MIDALEDYHNFATSVAQALNIAGVKPETDRIHAVMVIVAKESEGEPIGGSLNWCDKHQRWEVTNQAELSERLDDDRVLQ